MRVALATCAAMPRGAPDEDGVVALLGADRPVWSDPSVDWERYDRVVIRSTWDYTSRAHEFLAWTRAVGSQRLRNPPDVVAFNVDKRYLRTLTVPIVPTVFVEPGDPVPALDGELVVKPNISSGARDTGRFIAASHEEARRLIEAIQASGRTALVQTYQPSVDARGETALVFIGGELSHVLRKRAVLRDDGIAPALTDGLKVAKVMLEDDLMAPSQATSPELELARAVIAEIAERFGTPLYGRVDVVLDDSDRPMVMELELLEPSLYLGLAPGASERFATAILGS